MRVAVEDKERRLNPRVTLPYPARLWGMDMNGQAVKEDARLDNLSSSGLYLRLKRTIQNGSPASVAVRLSMIDARPVSALRLAARGVVVRTDALEDGTCGVAVKFIRRRVL